VLGIILLRVKSVERDTLVGTNARCFVRHGMRIDAVILHVNFGARNEERARLMNDIKSTKIDIAAIHDVDGSGLWRDQIQSGRITHFTVGNMDKTGDIAAQVEQRVHLDRRFGRAKIRPRKQRKTQINCCAVERIDCIGKVEANVVLQIKLARAFDENGGQIKPYAPIA
jgi:ABC-type transporter Mla MlaB component